MNANTLRIALATALIAGSSLVGVAHAGTVTTLEAVQVRPSADQLAQQIVERNSTIPTLPAVQVRPSADQLAELGAPRITTLAAVQVRPSAEQRASVLTRGTADTQVASQAAATFGALVGQVIVKLPVPHLQPSPSELEALIGASIGR
ncbi:hypothetical protein [Xanthomonas maliensis]|uniref:hypothetical protein n=1 Tax=Xanthomonas maliensis TaxID=1321368 RepID=UPI0003A85835|nr:hypothetical protein [Xanthomonas maliensis]KAB7769776.1 hypothetical protein CKY51_06495 [Xanthomonas maliensis]